jgi:GGDEF domain-containing protein
VILDLSDHRGDPTNVAERIVSRVGQVITTGRNEQIFVGASVGVALASDGIDANALTREADLAAYRAKAAGGSCFRLASSPAELSSSASVLSERRPAARSARPAGPA